MLTETESIKAFETVWLLVEAADSYWATGELREVAPLYRKAKELADSTFGEGSRLSIEIDYYNACLLAAQEKRLEAMALFERLIEATKITDIDVSPSRLADLHLRLADVIFEVRGLERNHRESLGFSALDRALQFLCPPFAYDDAAFVNLISRHAHWRYWCGHWEASAALYDQILAGWETAQVDSGILANAHLRLGLIRRGQAAGEKHFARYLELNSTRYGNDHPETAEALCRLASWLSNGGRFDEAASLFARAWKIWELHDLTDSPETSWMRSDFDRFIKESGWSHLRSRSTKDPAGSKSNDLDFEDLRVEARQTLQKMERVLEADDLALVPFIVRLATWTKDDESITLLLRAVSLIELSEGKRSKSLIAPLISLNAVYRNSERFAEAEEVLLRLDRIHDGSESAMRNSHSLVLEQWGHLRNEQGNPIEAKRYYVDAIEMASKSTSRADIYALAELRYRFACSLQMGELPEEVVDMVRLALSDLERAGDTDSFDRGKNYSLLASVLRGLGRFDEAEEAAARANEFFGKPGE